MPFITVDGVRVHYEEAGSGPPALLIHGWGASWKFWDQGLATLSPNYRAIAIDLPGYGESDKPNVPYTIDWYCGFVLRLLDAFGIQRAAFFGHSMGGMISSLFSSRHPDRVERLLVVNPPINGPASLYLKARLMLLPVLRWLVYLFMHIRFIRHWVAKDFTYSVKLRDDIVDDVIHCTFRSSLGSVQSLRTTDVTAHLRSIQAPSMVIGCENDGVIRPSQHAIAAREIPGARYVVLPETGHCPMFERPDEFHRHVAEFAIQPALDPAAAHR